jgi:hypothetical protein
MAVCSGHHYWGDPNSLPRTVVSHHHCNPCSCWIGGRRGRSGSNAEPQRARSSSWGRIGVLLGLGCGCFNDGRTNGGALAGQQSPRGLWRPVHDERYRREARSTSASADVATGSHSIYGTLVHFHANRLLRRQRTSSSDLEPAARVVVLGPPRHGWDSFNRVGLEPTLAAGAGMMAMHAQRMKLLTLGCWFRGL